VIQWFVVLTFATMLLMAFLGFTNFSHALFVNDKILVSQPWRLLSRQVLETMAALRMLWNSHCPRIFHS
jgi:hypothetical protein